MTLARLPIALFASVMGTAGLGLAWRGGTPLLGLPQWPGEAWIAIGALLFALLLAGYLAKLARHPAAVRAELADPAVSGMSACLPIGGGLLAAGLHPHAPGIALPLWWASAALLVAVQVMLLARWLRGGMTLAQVNGGWMVGVLGGLALALSGPTVGERAATAALFGASLVFMPVIMAFVFARVVAGPPIPPGARPLLYVFIVPPALVYIGMPALTGAPAGLALDGLLFATLLVLGGLLAASHDVLQWPFGPPWWAFTFPLDALAGATTRYAEAHPGTGATALAAVCLAAAFGVVSVVLYRTVAALARGTLLPAAAAPVK